MGKRSDLARVERDYYPTPRAALPALLSYLSPDTLFLEPCAGDGRLVQHLEAAGHVCVGASDIAPQTLGIAAADALAVDWTGAPLFITNPPWSRPLLHALIVTLSDYAPAWLLFDADWFHTVQAVPYLPRLRRYVSVGRLKWIEGTTMTGKDNCAWYLFTTPSDEPTVCHGRIDHAVKLRYDKP